MRVVKWTLWRALIAVTSLVAAIVASGADVKWD
jgi:hypothetical protein